MCHIGKNMDVVIGNCIFSYLMYMKICCDTWLLYVQSHILLVLCNSVHKKVGIIKHRMCVHLYNVYNILCNTDNLLNINSHK